jgi:foldase protein PrsA
VQVKCSYDLQKRAFPKAGSQEYQAIQSQLLQTMVQDTEFTQKSASVGATVTDKQVSDRVKSITKQFYGGSDKRFLADLKKNCVTLPEARDALRARLLRDAIYKKVTTGASVSDAEAKAYYDAHPQVYSQPQTRVVRHILVKDKKLADKLYAQLKAGADFAALAKKYSQDPGSKAQGGQLTISKGQTVPEFDKVAFALKTGELAKPVKTQFGWHIIRAEKPTVPRKTTPFAQVKEAIRQQLLQGKKDTAAQKWLDGVKKEYDSKVSYANGLAPAPTTTPTATTPPPATTG